MAMLNALVPPEFWNELHGRLAPWDIEVFSDPALSESGCGKAHVSVRGRMHTYDAVVVPGSRVAATLLDVSGRASSLVVSDHITTRTAQALRRAGVDYVDASGGASLVFDDVVVALSGSTAPRVRLRSGEMRPAANLFSAGRGQVLAVLLSWPRLLEEPVRVIARIAGTSVGLVHDVLSALEDLGHLQRSPRWRAGQIDDVRGLAHAWAAAFGGGLRRKIDLGSFHSDPRTWGGELDDALLGGEWAVRDALHPARVTVYAYRIDGPLIAGLRLRADASEDNTKVLRRFWQPPSLAESRRIPWLLTYAELSASPDARVRATAQDFLDRHAGRDR